MLAVETAYPKSLQWGWGPPITAMVADDSYVARRQVGAWAMDPQFILAVAAGGALGSVARYLVAIGSGKLFGPNFPFGTADYQRDRIGSDRCFHWSVRDQMGFTTSRSHLPYCRHLRRLHDVLHVLAGCLVSDRARTEHGGASLHGVVGGSLRGCFGRSAPPRQGASVSAPLTPL